VLWLQRNHFDFDRPWENVSFHLLSAFDVTGASGWSIESQIQPQNELWLIDGPCEIEQNNERVLAKSGDIVLLRAGQSRLTRNPQNTPLRIIGFSFSSQILGHIDFMGLLGLPLCFRHDKPQLHAWFDLLINSSRDESVSGSLGAQAWAQLIWSDVVSAQLRDSDTRSPEQLQKDVRSHLHPHLVRVLEHIAQHFAEPMNVDDLARVAHLSPKHLARLFKSSIGSAPSDYLRSFRLERARENLSRGEKSIAQVAHECGFEDAAYFSRAFKTHFSLSPLEYRGQLRQQTINQVMRRASKK
jgi:AraC-like DNA-binding protein